MANTSIPQLPMAIALTGAEQLEVVQNGTSVQTTVTATANAANTSAVLQQLAQPTGAALVGWQSALAGSLARTVSSKIGDDVSVKDFGAKGDGITDDTAAIQAAINATLTLSGGQIYFPSGVYKITAALTIPFSANWKISGASRGSTVIQQATANTQIFNLTSDLTWGWTIDELALTWANVQPATNTSAVAIYFSDPNTVSPGGYFNITIRRCLFNNGFRAIANDPTKDAPIWGFHVSDCVFQGGMTGASIYLAPSPQIGQPRICIENCQLNADNVTEANVFITAADTVELRSLEFLNGNAPVPHIQVSGCPGLTIINCRSENYNFGSVGGKALWNLSGSHFSIIGCVGTSMLGTAGTQYFIYATSGGVANLISNLTVNSSMTGGNILPYFASAINVVTGLAYSPTSGPGSVSDNLRSFLGNVALPVYYADSQMINATTTVGDASVTLTNTSDRYQLFSTTLTANRTCTLPSGSTMKNGATFTIIRRAATPGAFTLQVIDPSSGQNYTFASSTNGSVTYEFNQAGGWVIVSETN